MGTSCTWTLTLLTLIVSLIFVEATYSGGCYSNYGLNVTTCSEVYAECSSMSSCSYFDGKLSFYCYNVGCSGTWQNDSVTIDVCESVYFSTCKEADDALVTLGCECSKCNQNDDLGSIQASCYYPFNCSVQTYVEYENPDFFGPIYVYSAVAAALVLNAILASLCCSSQQNRELTTKEIVRMKLSCIGRCIYRMTLGSFVVEDGSRMQFIDYVCDKRDILGMIHCCKTTANLRPRWMRFGAFASTLLVAISLAFIFGTYVYNSEYCTYSQDTCDGVPMAVECMGGRGWVYYDAYALTTIFLLLVSKGSALAVNSFQMGSLSQKLQLAATLLIAIGLVIYGVLFSNNESKGEIGDDSNGDSRRLVAVGYILLVGWGFGEIIGLGFALCRFITCWVCYAVVYRSRLEKEKKSSAAAAIYPQETRKLDPVSIEAGRANSDNGPSTVVQEDGQKVTISSITTPDSPDQEKSTIEAEDGQKATSNPVDAAQVAVSVSKLTVEADEGQKPTIPPADATPAPVISKPSTEEESRQKLVSPSVDATPVPVNAPKPVTEGESQQKTTNPPVEAPAASAQANSPKAKIGGDKPTYRADAGKQMSTRFDRKRTLTENIKLEPPMRGTQQ